MSIWFKYFEIKILDISKYLNSHIWLGGRHGHDCMVVGFTLLISFWFVNRHGHHRQFLFLIGWFLIKSSPLKPLSQINRNLVGSIYGRSSTGIAHFVLIHWQTWPPQTILVSDWLISKKSSILKPLSQINRNLIGSILEMSSIMIAHLVPIH